MGCYGIGPSRIVGALVEVFHDNKGILWPDAVAPFQYHLINLSKSNSVEKRAEYIYQRLLSKGEEVLFDDRDNVSFGEKLKDADLIGVPCRLVISDKTDGRIEVKKRNEKYAKLAGIDDWLSIN